MLVPDSADARFTKLINWESPYASPEELMQAAVQLAAESAQPNEDGAYNCGPFGAIVADESFKVLSIGNNRVVQRCDSTAHAEVMAIRNAQRRLNSHDLSLSGTRKLTLFSSSEPCIQCFGVIWWSGLSKVYSAAPRGMASSIGFLEGPVSDELWDKAKAERGIEHISEFGDVEAVRTVLEGYGKAGFIY